MTPKKTLKKWFSNFMKPAQEHFAAWIDSFWHKSEQIPMSNIEGLSRAIENTASAGQLLNHINDTNAHRALFDELKRQIQAIQTILQVDDVNLDTLQEIVTELKANTKLQELIDKKVNKEDGKGLSSNDFTNELKQKLDGLQPTDVSGLLPKGGYEGTAQDLANKIENATKSTFLTDNLILQQTVIPNSNKGLSAHCFLKESVTKGTYYLGMKVENKEAKIVPIEGNIRFQFIGKFMNQYEVPPLKFINDTTAIMQIDNYTEEDVLFALTIIKNNVDLSIKDVFLKKVTDIPTYSPPLGLSVKLSPLLSNRLRGDVINVIGTAYDIGFNQEELELEIDNRSNGGQGSVFKVVKMGDKPDRIVIKGGNEPITHSFGKTGSSIELTYFNAALCISDYFNAE